MFLVCRSLSLFAALKLIDKDKTTKGFLLKMTSSVLEHMQQSGAVLD